VGLYRGQRAVEVAHEVALVAARARNQPEVRVFIAAAGVQGMFREERKALPVGRPARKQDAEIAISEALQFTILDRNCPDIASQACADVGRAIRHKCDQCPIRRPDSLSRIEIALGELARLSLRIVQIKDKELGTPLDVATRVETGEEFALTAQARSAFIDLAVSLEPGRLLRDLLPIRFWRGSVAEVLASRRPERRSCTIGHTRQPSR